jgi:hypothetical protein
MAVPKLWSHAALIMRHATAIDYAQLYYSTERDHGAPFEHTLGIANTDAYNEVPGGEGHDPRTVLPFGLLTPEGAATEEIVTGGFSQGMTSYWIRFLLELHTSTATAPPVVESLSLAYLPIPQNAATKAYTVPLPVDRDIETGFTAEQIIRKLESLSTSDPEQVKFLYLKDGQREYRAYISNISYVSSPAPDGPGALNLMVIQIPTGRPGLVGEVTVLPS